MMLGPIVKVPCEPHKEMIFDINKGSMVEIEVESYDVRLFEVAKYPLLKEKLFCSIMLNNDKYALLATPTLKTEGSNG